MTTWSPANKLEWYKVIKFVGTHLWNCKTAVSFLGVILNKSESNRMYHSANISTFLIAALEVGNLFCTKYR